MPRNLDFDTDGRDWPNRDASRFIAAGGIRWHLQEMGPSHREVPTLWLLHGTGAATHSWRTLMPELAQDFRVLAPDLPGHGFTSRPPSPQLSLPGMARLIGELINETAVPPDIIVGHSAGAAIALRMALDGTVVPPKGVISLAGALMPLGGDKSDWLSLAAKALAVNPLVPRIFAWRSRRASVVEELMSRTGSVIDADGMRFYSRVAQSSGHAQAALAMMANWNLSQLAGELTAFPVPLLLITGNRDGMIPTRDAEHINGIVPRCDWIRLPGLGHLAHEEDPEKIAGLIRDFAARG